MPASNWVMWRLTNRFEVDLLIEQSRAMELKGLKGNKCDQD
jgi:hypothetical protein